MRTAIVSVILIMWLNISFAQRSADTCVNAPSVSAYIAGTNDSTIPETYLRNGIQLRVSDTLMKTTRFNIGVQEKKGRYFEFAEIGDSFETRFILLEKYQNDSTLKNVGVGFWNAISESRYLFIDRIQAVKNGKCYYIPAKLYRIVH